MLSLFYYLLFFSILGITGYICLRKFQDKHTTKNKYDEVMENAFRYKQRKSRNQNNFHEFLPLIVLSVVSSLLIASITLIMYLLPDLELLGYFLLLFSVRVQYILVIPATLIVFFIISLSHSQIHLIFRAGIPLIFNILGASALSISYWVIRLPDQFLTQQYTATISNETIVPLTHWDGDAGYAYRVTLHIQNSSQEANSKLSIRIATKEGYWEPLGEWDIMDIPLGESDFTVNIPIDEFDYFNEFDPSCESTSVTKPLYLYYSVGYPNYNKSIIIDSNTSQQLLKLACESKP